MEPERARERLVFLAYRAGERLLGLLPRRVCLALAASAGNAAFDLARGKRELICANLSRPMRRSPRDRAVRRAARRAFRNYGKYLVDVMRIGSTTTEQLAGLVRIENIESLVDARAEGRGVLVCTVHIGGMDLIGPAVTAQGESFHVIADDTTYGRLYEHLAAIRARHGVNLIGWRRLRRLFDVLRHGGNLALFCDGGYRRGDVPVELCGEATTFPPGPATLAARTGAPILPVRGRRTADDRFEARGMPLIRVASSEPAEIHRATQALADELGAAIADDPGQWYMFRPIWPESGEDRAHAAAALRAARRGEDWSTIGA